jgi:hypothetical protein
MNDKSGGHRPRPAGLGLMGILAAMIGVVLLAACSSPHTTASGDSSTSSAYQQALAYAQCIRAHGVPSYPDPNSKGQFVIQNGSNNPTANVSLSVLNAAAKACQKLVPASMVKPPAGQGSTGDQTAELRWAACMRSHGEPGFPDPASDGSFTLPAGMDAESPQFQAALKACPRPSGPNGGSTP